MPNALVDYLTSIIFPYQFSSCSINKETGYPSFMKASQSDSIAESLTVSAYASPSMPTRTRGGQLFRAATPHHNLPMSLSVQVKILIRKAY